MDDDETQWVIWAGPAIVIMAYLCMGAMFALRTYVHAKYSHSDDILMEIGALINGQLDGAEGQAETKKKVIEEQQVCVYMSVSVRVSVCLSACVCCYC